MATKAKLWTIINHTSYDKNTRKIRIPQGSLAYYVQYQTHLNNKQ